MSEPFGSEAGPAGTADYSDSGIGGDGGNPVENTSSSPGSVNPAWQQALQPIPNEFRKGLQEHFTRWDQNYNKLAREYSPWKNFADNQISPQDLQQAWELRGLIEQNPHEVLRRLSTALGVQLSQGEMQQDEESQEQMLEEESDDPRWRQFQQRQEMQDQNLQKIAQFLQNQEYQGQVSHYEREIDQEIEALKQQHGDFDVVDVLQRAQMMEEPNIPEAFRQQQEFLQREFQRTRSTANSRAPQVQSPNGGIPPSAEKNPAQYTQQERIAAFGAMMRAMNPGG